ncbi:MAG: FtsQ-type POTRA domain-containing protein [Pseudomonadota bacterium]
MKQQNISKTPKKPNILLRRRLKVYFDRSLLTIKILALGSLCLLIFTNYLDPIKHIARSYLLEYSSDSGGIVLENVLVAGQNNLSTSDIVSYLNADVGTPLLSINIDDIRKALEENDWVKEVVIERRLPSTIYINISEREPIAIWQHNKKLNLVDADAHVIKTENIEKFSKLLHVVGSDAHLHAGNLNHELRADPELAKKIVSAVRYGERRWNIILEQDITVKMPSDQDFAGAFAYLSKLYKAGKLFDHQYKTIDLRDKTKYYFEQ